MIDTRLLRFFGPMIGGVLFAIGLGLSGMLEPKKIISFLDITGNWDPSLIFVMVGAIGTHLILYRFIINRPFPLWDVQFHIPTRKDLDWKLLSGSSIFGIGWGISGMCPGPGIASLASGHAYALLFVAFLLLGVLLAKMVP